MLADRASVGDQRQIYDQGFVGANAVSARRRTNSSRPEEKRAGGEYGER
ncbi:hypothetical protein QG37_02969 [Candidozyma auris]|nr:hypothetical protein QG37_02969 [[Candida] auris]